MIYQSYGQAVSMLHHNVSRLLHLLFIFDRVMHFSAERGIAIACGLSVCPSVCL